MPGEKGVLVSQWGYFTLVGFAILPIPLFIWSFPWLLDTFGGILYSYDSRRTSALFKAALRLGPNSRGTAFCRFLETRDLRAALDCFDNRAPSRSTALPDSCLIRWQVGLSHDRAPWCRRAADGGSPAAQYLYGRILEQGRGALRNKTSAMGYYLRAARGDCLQAARAFACEAFQTNSSDLWADAIGPLEAGARQNDGFSFWLLSKAYSRGLGTRQDEDRARAAIARAADLGIDIAQGATCEHVNGGDEKTKEDGQ
jgi:hypothetical protein